MKIISSVIVGFLWTCCVAFGQNTPNLLLNDGTNQFGFWSAPGQQFNLGFINPSQSTVLGFWVNGERMRIAPNGNVAIGTSNATNSLTLPLNSGTDPIADAWTVYSSRRWKTDVRTIEGALGKVQRLRGVSYESKGSGRRDFGLIAEEVGEVVPEVVTYEDNGRDAVALDYARLVALLVEAIKDQQREIDVLKAKVSAAP